MQKQYYVFKINISKLNIVSFLLLFLCLLITFLIDKNLLIEAFRSNFLILFILIFVYFVLHEILHCIGYVIHGAKLKNITFGMELEKGVFYCLCKQDISRKNILNAVMFPLFYIGIVTYIIGVIFKFPILTFLSIMNISGAAADIFYFLFIFKLNKDIKFSELDDGTSFAILATEDVSLYRHYGIDYVETLKEIPRNDFKKIKISKASYIILPLLIVLFTLLMILQ